MEHPHKKKREHRRAYLNDFTRTASGEYVYTGVTYAFQGGEQRRRRCMLFFILLTFVMLAAGIAAGCIPAPGMDRCPYVLLPYTFSLVAAGSVAWGMGRLAAGGDPLRRYVYRATVPQLPLRAALAMAGAGTALAGEALYLVLNGPGEWWPGALGFLLCQGMILAGGILWRRLFPRLEWTPSREE